jgi:micrococcal nuclease
MYTYEAKVVRVVDGDTIDLDIDLGFHIRITKRIRLSFINAPEMNTDLGKRSKDFLLKSIPQESNVIIKTQLDRTDKYGRVLGEIFAPDQISSINKLMIDGGFAEYYNK